MKGFDNWQGSENATDTVNYRVYLVSKLLVLLNNTAKNVKFSIKGFFSKCDQIRRKLRIWSHLLKKSLIKKLHFLCIVMEITRVYMCASEIWSFSNFCFQSKNIMRKFIVSLLPFMYKMLLCLVFRSGMYDIQVH